MGSEPAPAARGARLLLAALLWIAAGWLAHLASATDHTQQANADDTPARLWTGVALLVAGGLVVAWPLLQPPARAASLPEPQPAADARRLALVEAQLEQLPVAAWVRTDAAVRPLTVRARRLAAPGRVRDPASLDRLLRSAADSGQAAPVVIDTERGDERWQLRRQRLALDGQQQTLLVLVPLERELESEALLAWQQLVQVLTHEIMNSLTPIKSLSETALVLLDEPEPSAPGDAAHRSELRLALDAIARRADGLSGFVGNYRRVSQWPAPALAPVQLQAVFARLQHAVAPRWTARGGTARFELASPSLQLLADEGQLEQALLALLRNAEQATASSGVPPQLWVQAEQGPGGRLRISVRDNGSGVPAGLEQQIFLPFFSAREGGQGIGLAVVRQLVSGMGGTVRHVRPIEGGAAFVLSF